jgi:hypothetical protein
MYPLYLYTGRGRYRRLLYGTSVETKHHLMQVRGGDFKWGCIRVGCRLILVYNRFVTIGHRMLHYRGLLGWVTCPLILPLSSKSGICYQSVMKLLRVRSDYCM